MMLTQRRVGLCVITIVTLAALPATIRAQDALRVTGGEVTVLCPLTIGGSFEAKTKALSGEVAVPSTDPQSAIGNAQSTNRDMQPVGTSGEAGQTVNGNAQALQGELVVNLQTLETGIGLRDRHMRTKYLEVDRGPAFAVARLQDIRVDRLSGKTPFRGTLTLHGETREVSGTADIKPNGAGYRLEATFPVRVSDFGIPEPSYLGVGVKDELRVRVNLSAAPAAAAREVRK